MPRMQRRLSPPQPRPLRRAPSRPFTDDDMRHQQHLLRYGGTWEDQYDVPARPWSSDTEDYTREIRMATEQADWEASRRGRQFSLESGNPVVS